MKQGLQILFAVLFILGGIYHFAQPRHYSAIMPEYLSWHVFLVGISGFFEILLGVLLLVPRFTRAAAWCLIALIIAILPANIDMALNARFFHAYSSLELWLRIPFQVAFVAWAWTRTQPGFSLGRLAPELKTNKNGIR